MKHDISLITGALLIAAAAGANAQTTATTDPVGYITMNVSGASGPVAGISLVGATLVNKAEVATSTAAGSAGSAINLPAGVVTAGQFGVNAINQPLFYVEIASGTDEGVFSDIASNSSTVLTVTDAIGAKAPVGTRVIVRKHHTFDSLFGATIAQAKLTPGVDLNSADEVVLLDAQTQLATSYFFNSDDLATVGWTNARTGQPAGVEVIAPGSGMKIIRRVGSATPVIQVGHVKTGKTVLPIESNLNLLTIPLATGVTLVNSNLVASGLNGGVDLNTADNVVDLLNNVPTSYFFSTDDLDPGWKPSNATLKEGSCVLLLRRGASFNWIAPAQIIAP